MLKALRKASTTGTHSYRNVFHTGCNQKGKVVKVAVSPSYSVVLEIQAILTVINASKLWKTVPSVLIISRLDV